MTAPTWTHKGVTIHMDDRNGTFYATIGGATQTAQSVAAMRKRIDAAGDSIFPFPACIFSYYNGETKDVQVTGIERPRRGSLATAEWNVSGGHRGTERTVYRDNPGFRDAVKRYQDAISAFRVAERAHKAELAKIDADLSAHARIAQDEK